MTTDELKQFGKDALAAYILKNIFREDDIIIRELRRLEWQIKTGNLLRRMNEYVEALNQKPPIKEALELHRKYDIAQQALDAANEYFYNGKWRTKL